jgi:hypothetical protein
MEKNKSREQGPCNRACKNSMVKTNFAPHLDEDGQKPREAASALQCFYFQILVWTSA